MKMTAEKLKEICDSYGIKGRNQENLIKGFFTEYPNAELESEKLRSSSDLCFTNAGRCVLTFSGSTYTHPYDGGFRVPAIAELWGKDFFHTFIDSNEDKILWEKTNKYLRTEIYDNQTYIEKGKGEKKEFTQFQKGNKTIIRFYKPNGYQVKKAIVQDDEKGTLLRYNEEGKLDALIIRNEKEVIKKEGIWARVAAHKRKLPLKEGEQPYNL